MSTLWTPDGERPVSRQPGPSPAEASPAPGGGPSDVGGTPDEAVVAAQLDELRQQLASAPVAMVIANHAYGLFELAAVHLSQQPPHLDEARLAVDALAALVEGLPGRLGEAEADLVQGLAQLRLTFVQIMRAAGHPQA